MTSRQWLILAGGAAAALALFRSRRHRPIEGFGLPSGTRIRTRKIKGGFNVGAFSGGKKIGNLNVWDRPGRSEVRQAMVLSSHRRQGVAQALYKEAARRSCSIKDKPLTSEAFQRSGDATKLWQALKREGLATFDAKTGRFSISCDTDLEGAQESLIAMPREWWRAIPPPPKVCYMRKSDALKAFADRNTSVIERAGGMDFRYGPAEFDAINHKYGLEGKRQVRTIAEAMWVALPPGKPFCLDEMDLAALNDTTPGKEHPVGFQLPDHVEEQRHVTRQEEHYRSQAPSSDVPF